jgi:DNA-binding response OmpR family regulator
MKASQSTHFSLEKASILLVDADNASMSIVTQILSGFGAKSMHKCASGRDARQIAERSLLDLVIVDPAGGDAEMRGFIPWLRRNEATRNRFAQCIIATGHTRQAEVSAARDFGANYVVVKPLSPKLLIDRLAWMSNDPRGFVSTAAYAGPDRRFRFDGPPAGSNGRRYDDQTLVVSEFGQPNLSQDAVDAMMKPRRISI